MSKTINDFSELIEYLDEKFQGIDKSFQGVATKTYVDEKISPLPTKSYLDEKFADLEGDLIVKLRKEDQKLNRLLDILKQKNLLSESELAELASLQVFPKQTKMSAE